MKILAKPGNFSDQSKTDKAHWKPFSAKSFKVRIGPDYVSNGRKDDSDIAFYNVVAIDGFLVSSDAFSAGQNVDFEYLERISNAAPSTSSKSSLRCAVKQASALGNEKIAPNAAKSGDQQKALPRWMIVSVIVPTEQKLPFGKKRGALGNFFAIYAKIDAEAVSIARDQNDASLQLLQHFVSGVTPKTSPGVPVQKRFKVIAKVLNLDELKLPRVVTGLLQKYNGKPFLARTSTTFFGGDDFFEVQIDINKFSYLSLLGLNNIRSYLPAVRLSLGFVLQAEADAEMPERVLICFALHHLDLEALPELLLPSTSAGC